MIFWQSPTWRLREALHALTVHQCTCWNVQWSRRLPICVLLKDWIFLHLTHPHLHAAVFIRRIMQRSSQPLSWCPPWGTTKTFGEGAAFVAYGFTFQPAFCLQHLVRVKRSVQSIRAYSCKRKEAGSLGIQLFRFPEAWFCVCVRVCVSVCVFERDRDRQ